MASNGKAIELASAYISLSARTDGIPGEIERALNKAARDVHIDVHADTAQAAAEVETFRRASSRHINIDVDVDTRRSTAQVNRLRRDLSTLGKLNLGAAGIASLPMLAAGLVGVASALQQVSQAALAIPGGIGGAVSSVGTLAFGLTGIADAYDAVTKAADEAATSGADQASQARAAASASNSLRNAVVDEASARKDVARATRDAQNALQDLRIEQRGGVIDEKRAILEAQKAREDLYTGNYSDARDAILRVEEADQRLIETRERNRQRTEELADANVKGIANSDLVVAANERLIRSQQNVAEAQGAVAASAPQASAAQEAAALAMGRLAPQAQDFVAALRELATGPGLDLRNLVQGNIFEGLDGELRDLTKKAFPTFERGLGGISKAWNENFRELGDVLGSDSSLTLLDRIFGNTAEAQSRLKKTINPLVKGLGTLTAAGSDALPRLADAFTGVSERFANFITEADEDGRLDKWIDEGITALGDLGETALNVGKMFTAITNAAGMSNILSTVSQLTNKWQLFLNSTAGQQAIKNFLNEGRAMFERWRPILEDLPGLMQGIYTAARDYIGAVITVVQPVTDFLSNHPKLVELAAEAYLIFKSARVIGSLAEVATKLTGMGDSLLGLPDKANKAAVGINKALALIVVPAIGDMINDEIQRFLKENFPDLYNANNSNTPDQLGKKAREWFDQHVLGIPPAPPPAVQGPPSPSTVLPPAGAPTAIAPNVQGPPSQAIAPSDLGGLLGVPDTAAAPASYGLRSGANSGGYGGGGVQFPDWVNQIAAEFGIKPSTYGGHQESDRQEAGYAPNPQHLNRGIDWTGPTANLQRFADYLATIPHNLEQVIWENPNTGQKTGIGGGHINPGYYPQSTYNEHGGGGNNIHVHTRQSLPIPLPRTYDQGGVLPPGMTLAHNATGQDEYILSPQDIDWLKSQGIDPVQGPPADSGITPDQLASMPSGAKSPLEDLFRTGGFIPAAAGNTGVAGTSSLAGFLNLGAEATNGVIDIGADLGKMAASAALTAGTFGGGAAAGPAAGIGIDILAGMAKRGVSYGFQMASIGADALVEQLFPFGAPRWIGYDYTQFAPQLGIQQAMTTTGEMLKPAVAAAVQNSMNPGVDPNTTQHGAGLGAAPGGPVNPSTMPGAAMPLPPPPTDPFGTNASANPGPGNTGSSGPNAQQDDMWSRLGLPGGVYDTGGVLPAQSVAVNLSKRPEHVLTQNQFRAMEQMAMAGGGRRGSDRGGISIGGDLVVGNYNEMVREMNKARRLEMRQYSGRAGLS